jgi:hypothetical protein
MAIDSKRFPLQSAIKKIFADPKSRPELPVLEEGSSVGDDNFGEVERYDTGKLPAIALNDGNVVVEVHESQNHDTLWYHVGKVEGNKIAWRESIEYDEGIEPSVAITNDGLVVEVHQVHQSQNRETLWYHVGRVNGDTIDWGDSIEYDDGIRPSVAITNDGLVVEVHKSENHDKLYYHVGRVNGDTIEWGESIQYDDGIEPSVAITNDGLVVEVHKSENHHKLYYHVGRVNGDTIEWGESIKYDDGVQPSVAITNDGLVVEVHKSQSHDTLWYHIGKVEGDKITWRNDGKSTEYGNGKVPKVACNGMLAVETHQEGSDKLLCSVLTLPAFRSNWIQLPGENSYCYCACNSAATNEKQRHASNKTMNVKEGAPYFYAVLTKDDDSIDFPTGAILTIQGPDGTNYDRDTKEENQLVIMSGSSVRCLIIKDPKPGDWKMTMTVPEGVGFHCECNTVPSKDPYKTITTTLSKLHKRGLDDVTITGWLGAAATGATIGATIGTAGGPLGVLLGAVVGAEAGNVTYFMTQTLFPPSPTPTLQTATNLGQAAQTLSVEMSTPPTPQNGRYNLLMAERPGTIYTNLVNYNPDLTHPGRNPNSFPVEMTRHHIIPYNQLRRFWNRMVQEGHLTNSAAPLFSSIENLLNQHVLLTNFTLNEADRQQVIQLLQDIRQRRVTHDANGRSPNGWDSLQQVYAWMPGNLFIGPSGNFRTDDPGEEFEGNAGVVVPHGFEAFQTANNQITQYESNHAAQLAQRIANTLNNINSRNQPFDLNSDNWEQVNDNGRIRYRLRRR